MLALLVALNLAFHGRALGWLGALPFEPLRIAADVVMLMIVVVRRSHRSFVHAQRARR